MCMCVLCRWAGQRQRYAVWSVSGRVQFHAPVYGRPTARRGEQRHRAGGQAQRDHGPRRARDVGLYAPPRRLSFHWRLSVCLSVCLSV